MLGFLFCFVCGRFYHCCVLCFVVLGFLFLGGGGGGQLFLVGWLVVVVFWGVKCTKSKQNKKCISILAFYLHHLQSIFKPQASCVFF